MEGSRRCTPRGRVAKPPLEDGALFKVAEHVFVTPDIQFIDYPQNQITFMYWQQSAPPFNDIRVRQALQPQGKPRRTARR